MAFPSLASIDVAYDFLISGQADVLRHHLQVLARYVHKLLLDICQRQPGGIRVKRDPPRSPIIPIFTPRSRDLAGYCQKRGFMVRPIVPPTVPAGTERARICLHAGNTREQAESLCRTIEAWIGGLKGVHREHGGGIQMSRGDSKFRL
jgi:8-amino-7-oxononanoate synthase